MVVLVPNLRGPITWACQRLLNEGHCACLTFKSVLYSINVFFISVKIIIWILAIINSVEKICHPVSKLFWHLTLLRLLWCLFQLKVSIQVILDFNSTTNAYPRQAFPLVPPLGKVLFRMMNIRPHIHQPWQEHHHHLILSVYMIVMTGKLRFSSKYHH